MSPTIPLANLESHLWEAANILRGIEKVNPETLYGIFGDAQWTNKERLSDALLRDLIEHFSRIDLVVDVHPELTHFGR